MRIVQKFTGLVLTSMLVACGGDSSSGNGSPDTSSSSSESSATSSSESSSSSQSSEPASENEIVELRFSAENVQIPQYTTTELTLSAIRKDGTIEELTSGVEYTVGNQDLMTYDVLEEGIELLAEEQGETFLTAIYDDLSVSTDVEIVSPVVISLALSGASELALGDSLQVSVEATYEGEVTKDVTEAAEFTVSEEGVLLGDTAQNGRYSTQSVGTTTVTVTIGGVSESHPVEVLPAALQDVTVSPTTEEITQGESIQFTLTGHYSDGSEKDVTEQTEWSVDVDSVGAFSSDTPGLFESIGSGDVVVVGMANGLEASADLYVAADPNAPSSITLTASPNVLLAGSADSSEVSVTVIPNSSDGVIVDGTEVLVTKGTEDAQTYQTLEGGFALDIDAPAGSGSYSVMAEVVGSTVQESINLQVVGSFSSVLSTSRSSGLVIINNYFQAGSDFSGTISNTSNREFSVISAEFVNGDNIRDTYFADDYPDIFNNGVLPGGESVGLTITLNSSLEDNGVAIRFNLQDESTGELFSKTVDFDSSFQF